MGPGGDRRRARDAHPRSSTTSRGADFVVLAGSLPRKVPTSFYEDTIRELARRDVRVVLDSEGEPLRVGVEAGPFLVSPNQREAEQLVGQELEDDDDFLMALDAIAEMGARNVLITLENGCFALLRSRPARRRACARSRRTSSPCRASARGTSSSPSSSPRSSTRSPRRTPSASPSPPRQSSENLMHRNQPKNKPYEVIKEEFFE